MTARRFPTHETEEQLRDSRGRGVEPVPLYGTPAPGLPSHVVEAVAAALREPQTVPPRGVLALREALAVELDRTTGRRVDPHAEVVITNGAMHALGLVFRALLEPGDEVVVPAPTFFFAGPIEAAGGRCRFVASSVDAAWRWDAGALESAIGPRTRVLLLCNPGNPTGRAHDATEIAEAVAVAERHGLVVVTDEAYEATLYDGSRLVSAFARTAQCLVIRSLGKSLSMPHLRLGCVAGPADLVDRVATELEWDVLRVGIAPQAAALAALDGPRDWLEAVREGLERDRAVALRAVAETTTLRVIEPGAGPFLFLGAHDELAGALLSAGLPAVDGRHFGSPGWARLPFGGAAALAAPLRGALARAEGTLRA